MPQRQFQHITDASPRLAHTHRVLQKLAFEGISVLDLGSRDGSALKPLFDRPIGAHLVATDFHNRVENGIEFHSVDLEHPLPFESASFDCVICTDVIEHVERKQQLTREIKRVSRSKIIISLPNTQHRAYLGGLKRGNMGEKYVFDVEDGVDRHRWVTFYDENRKFVEKYFDVVEMVDIVDKPKHVWRAKRWPTQYVRNQFFYCEQKVQSEA